MKLKFKHQKFQADASKAVVDVFSGQPCLSSSYMIDRGYIAPKENEQQSLFQEEEKAKQRALSVGFCNHPIIPNLSKNILCENLNKVQRIGQRN